MRASAPRKLNNIEFTDRSSYSRLEGYSTYKHDHEMALHKTIHTNTDHYPHNYIT